MSNLNEPAINSLFAKGSAEPSAQAAAPVWEQVNEAIMKSASVVPLISEGKVYLHGSGVTGDIISDVYGAPTPFDISVQG